MKRLISWLFHSRRAIVIIKKDLRIYYRKGPVLIFGILLPFFFFLAFMFGREIESNLLVAGLAGMSLWFTSTAITPVISPWETRTRTLERLLSMPISVTNILIGDILASSIVSLLITSVALIAVLNILGLNILHPYLLISGMLISSVCFSALGVLISALPTDVPSDVMMLSTLIKFPIIFVSGIFVPVERLPDWGIVLSQISPLTYFVDILRFSMGEKGSPMADIFVLIFFGITFIFLSVFTHKKTLPRRV
jgi:ABC-2 type transport system permease protein